MEKEEILKVLQAECSAQNVDAKLLQAIISVESSWNTWVCRFEPTTDKYVITADIFAKKNVLSVDSETVLQKTSFGLSQVMGFNYRALGFTGLLPQMFDPSLNVKYMALFFKKRCDKYEILEHKIASYNAGSPRKGADGKYVNQVYVDKVMGFYKQL